MHSRGCIEHLYMLTPDLTSLVPPEFIAIMASSEDSWHSLPLFFLQLYSYSLIMVMYMYFKRFLFQVEQ